jgi:hypothetical protein
MKSKFLSLIVILFFLVSCFTVFQFPTVKANPGIIRVQGNARGTSVTSTISVTLASTPTSGNVLVAVIGFFASASRSVSSISETSVSWTMQVRKEYNLYGVYAEMEIWFGVVSAGASTSITVTLSGAATFGATADVCEYSGVVTTNFLDKTASTSGNNAYPKTGTTATTTQADELWIGGTVLYGYAQTTPTNGFALLDGVLSNYESTGYLEKIVSATGTANSQTTGSIQQWAGCIATFFAAAPPPPPAEERSFTFTETMKPSANLYQWQEQRQTFIETTIMTSTFNQWQERYQSFTETLTIGGVSVTTVSYKISSDNDDGYRQIYTAHQDKYLITASTLDAAGKDVFPPDDVIDDAFSRFANIAVPNGANILNATITLTSCYDENETTVKWKILGDLEANPTAISSYNDYTNRPKTTAYVLDNNVPAWTTNNTYAYDITTIVSEIVAQSEWTSNNAMQIFIMNNGSDSGVNHLRGWIDYWLSTTQCVDLEITFSTAIAPTMFYYWQEHYYLYEQIITSSGTITYWQEQFYLFPESISPSATLMYGIEMLYRFFEYTFTETIKPSGRAANWIFKPPFIILRFKPPTLPAPQPPIPLLLIIPIAIAIALIVFSKKH